MSEKTLADYIVELNEHQSTLTTAYNAMQPFLQGLTPAGQTLDFPSIVGAVKGSCEAIQGTLQTVENSLAELASAATLKSVSSAPANSSAGGNVGEFFVDAGFFYLCVAPSSWVRLARDSWA